MEQQPAAVHLRVKDHGSGGETLFKLKRSTKLGKMMTAYCARKHVDESVVKFLFDGVRLRSEQTVDDLGLEEDDWTAEDGIQIDAMLEQVGGMLPELHASDDPSPQAHCLAPRCDETFDQFYERIVTPLSSTA